MYYLLFFVAHTAGTHVSQPPGYITALLYALRCVGIRNALASIAACSRGFSLSASASSDIGRSTCHANKKPSQKPAAYTTVEPMRVALKRA